MKDFPNLKLFTSLVHLVRDFIYKFVDSLNMQSINVTPHDIFRKNPFKPRIIVDLCIAEWREEDLISGLKENGFVRKVDFIGKGWMGKVAHILQDNLSVVEVECQYSGETSEETKVEAILKRNKLFAPFQSVFQMCEKNMILTMSVYQSLLQNYGSTIDKYLLLLGSVQGHVDLVSVLLLKGLDIYEPHQAFSHPFEVR